jgi:uracil-DNA glycosylase
MDSQLLAKQYLQILSDLDASLLDPHRPNGDDSKHLSGLFLSSVPKNFHLAKNKIMIVGSETRSWNVLKKNERFSNLPEYIEKSMTEHQKFFEEELKKKNSRGNTFHNFTRSIARKCGKDGIIYSNLFCFSWKKGSPIHCDYFETVQKYSELLLKQQITFFKPEIIIFANGIKSAPSRRLFFPIKGNDQVFRNESSNLGISKHHLWEFQLNDGIRCFRIHHPSARSKDAAKAREILLTLLPSEV